MILFGQNSKCNNGRQQGAALPHLLPGVLETVPGLGAERIF
jgi:hypothetical protein